MASSRKRDDLKGENALMDIQIYEDIKQGLKSHFKDLNLSKAYNPAVVGFEPSNPTYPMVKIQEPRNVPFESFRGRLETIANLGYKVDIYAKQQVGVSKQDVARKLMKYCNDYLTCIGLRLVSSNEIENDGQNGDLYHIILMFNANYFEQRKTILL